MHVEKDDLLADLAEGQLEPMETSSDGRFTTKLEIQGDEPPADRESPQKQLDGVEVQAAPVTITSRESKMNATTSSLNTVGLMEEQEAQLQKYEADIRQHISIEQQLQVYIDGLKQKIEDLETELKWAHKDLEEKEQEE